MSSAFDILHFRCLWGNPGEVEGTGSFPRMEFRREVWAGDRVRVTNISITTKAAEVNEISLEEGWNGMRMNE